MMKVLELLMVKAELKKIMLTVFKHNQVPVRDSVRVSPDAEGAGQIHDEGPGVPHDQG
jgi:hypothetical protein